MVVAVVVQAVTELEALRQQVGLHLSRLVLVVRKQLVVQVHQVMIAFFRQSLLLVAVAAVQVMRQVMVAQVVARVVLQES